LIDTSFELFYISVIVTVSVNLSSTAFDNDKDIMLKGRRGPWYGELHRRRVKYLRTY